MANSLLYTAERMNPINPYQSNQTYTQIHTIPQTNNKPADNASLIFDN